MQFYVYMVYVVALLITNKLDSNEEARLVADVLQSANV